MDAQKLSALLETAAKALNEFACATKAAVEVLDTLLEIVYESEDNKAGKVAVEVEEPKTREQYIDYIVNNPNSLFYTSRDALKTKDDKWLKGHAKVLSELAEWGQWP